MATSGERKSDATPPGDDRLPARQRLAYLEQKLRRFEESHERSDRKAREWMAEIKGEIEDLKSSLVS